ncbi:MAG: restriction endonuclease [Clostridiales bacterium]|nr:restriction endonuclease [Clostridiales bacterium]
MSVPKFFEFFEVFLKVLADGEIHSSKDVRNEIALAMNLTAEDLAEMLPSRKQTTYFNRVMWARTYLNNAGLIETPSRGQYRITEEGKKALKSGEKVDFKYLEQFDRFKAFHTANPKTETASEDSSVSDNESPMEVLDTAFRKVEDMLASELIDEVMKLSPTGFEALVVELLLKMGYGNGIDNAGRVTQATNDGGIDGIIKEDQLGFSNIYIQAKQWATDRTVDKPEIQKFVGALQGQQAQKGLFITTARFTSGAIKYSENLLGTKVVLIDGEALTKLMIKHDVGVSVEQTYTVRKLDRDFFEEL